MPSPTYVWPSSNICPLCHWFPKHPKHRFCSITCAQAAAQLAPKLIYLSQNHESSMDVAAQFLARWRCQCALYPRLIGIFMITWTEQSQKAFENYRDKVEARGHFEKLGLSAGNEQKRFRCAARACTLGESGNLSPCNNVMCELCETLRYGFGPHLERKRNIPQHGNGIRLGAGIYTSHTSSKAAQYAMNRHDPDSGVKAMFVCRAVIGRPYKTKREDPTLEKPPIGYDCVYGKPGWRSQFQDDEYVFYDPDAIRAAYLVLYYETMA
ncbi:hypothetical protein HYDPIDRAFT_84369 [Hydnomerulius pinastri MD-312]|nr:hypothetical protein HYDPIDRAFT_84369 [Hydnomerulius pinastri MD-312]